MTIIYDLKSLCKDAFKLNKELEDGEVDLLNCVDFFVNHVDTMMALPAVLRYIEELEAVLEDAAMACSEDYCPGEMGSHIASARKARAELPDSQKEAEDTAFLKEDLEQKIGELPPVSFTEEGLKDFKEGILSYFGVKSTDESFGIKVCHRHRWIGGTDNQCPDCQQEGNEEESQ